MNHENSNYDKNVIARMTHIVLTEILEQVLGEFEKSTGTRIGRVHMSEADSPGLR